MKRLYSKFTLLLTVLLCVNSIAKAQKIADGLLRLANQDKATNARVAAPNGLAELGNDFIQIMGNKVVVEATTTRNNVDELKAELAALGMTNISSYGPVVSGLLPIAKIEEMNTIATLRFAYPGYKPETRVGSVTSQSFTALNVDRAQEKFGVTGKGVKIGILSDSYNTLGGEAAGIASGNLPPEGVEILKELDETGIDEGRGMAELIYDIAPDADLAFYTAFESQTDFAAGIIALQEAGCDVIVDDIGYLTEPYFQDGVISQAVDEVVLKGASYYSSAGNSSNDAFQDTGIGRFGGELDLTGIFNLSTGETYTAPLEGELYDFSGNGQFKRSLTLNTGQNFTISLQWVDPYFIASGDSTRTAKTDLDFFLVFPDLGLAFSAEEPNLITGDPIEFNGVSWNGEGVLNVELYVLKREGPEPKAVRYIDRDGQAAFATELPGDNQATAWGHSNAALGISVGATRYTQTPRFRDAEPEASNAFFFNRGKDKDEDQPAPPIVEGFSSVGGIPIFFSPSGRKLWFPRTRRKPEFVASQGDNNSFFGFDFEGDGFPNFFGTSASAPNSAAIAALMIEASSKSRNFLFRIFGLSPFAIEYIFSSTALDMDNIYTEGFDEGFDFNTGYGFINAEKAVAKVLGVDPDDFEDDDDDNDRRAPVASNLEGTDPKVPASLNVFPTVTNGTVTFLAEVPAEQTFSLNVINTLGQQVYQISDVGNFEEQIDFSRYGRGVYMANFRSNNVNKTIRFVVE